MKRDDRQPLADAAPAAPDADAEHRAPDASGRFDPPDGSDAPRAASASPFISPFTPLSAARQPDNPAADPADDLADDADEAPTARPTPDLADQRDVLFLTPSPAALRLADSAVYRPSGLVGLALIAGPAICVIVAAPGIVATGRIPLWLPIALLLWLPALALVWALLKSVRLTPDALECGRALGQWSAIGFDEVERVEQRGLRVVVTGRHSQTLSFTPALLSRGVQLRRALLLQLPLRALVGDLRAESQRLSAGDEATAGDISGVLTVRTRRAWPIGVGALVAALLALGVAALLGLRPPLGVVALVAVVALAVGCALVGLWSVQEIFVSDKGLIIHYPLLRREGDVFWTQIQQVSYTPGELALLYRGGARTRVSIGPGLLTASQARLMRQYINRYSQAEVAPAWSHRVTG